MFHPSTFDSVEPTQEQVTQMRDVRYATKAYAHILETTLPDGPDKTYILRKLRELSMWVNTTILRTPDGAPRP